MFDLSKATEQVKFVLEKNNLSNVRAQVAVNLDVSGSAESLFKQGLMQQAFQRIMPIALQFDLNGEVDVFTFADGNSIAHVEPAATVKNYSNYVKKNILENNKVPKWGGTDYAPVLQKNLEAFEFYVTETTTTKKGWFGGSQTSSTTTLKDKSKSGDPVVVYFFTDGANSDKSRTTALLQEMQDKGTQMYVHFIGIGNANFSYIEQLGDKFDNTGFLSIGNIANVDENTIYEQLIPNELVEWFKSR